mmetsp:Transcript_3453/g.7001  ORF Transcript_3453/g.7001 Transcript_3453/m.7001 type:complete len:207 (+) Transcript_3453:200-820(+)
MVHVTFNRRKSIVPVFRLENTLIIMKGKLKCSLDFVHLFGRNIFHALRDTQQIAEYFIGSQDILYNDFGNLVWSDSIQQTFAAWRCLCLVFLMVLLGILDNGSLEAIQGFLRLVYPTTSRSFKGSVRKYSIFCDWPPGSSFQQPIYSSSDCCISKSPQLIGTIQYSGVVFLIPFEPVLHQYTISLLHCFDTSVLLDGRASEFDKQH